MLLIVACYLTWKRLCTLLRFFQQEAYHPRDFLAWFWERKAFDRKATLICLLSLFLLPSWLGITALLLVAYLEPNPFRSGKVKLARTARAKRTLIMSLFLASSVLWIPVNFFTLILWTQSLPLLLVAASLCLEPYESSIQKRYRTAAQERLKEVDPTIIGITGSYGKTSTKHALGQLLQLTCGPTFWPPKGINTVMGTTRSIREVLRPGFEYAVFEMGAYRKGSIERLCRFTPPRAAIITAVGLVHLNRFGDAEAVYKAKSELAQAVPKDGILVCNGDDPRARRMGEEYPKRTTLLYGLTPDNDCYASDIQADPRGTAFKLHWKGKSYSTRINQVGMPALSNSLAAFTMTCALGADPYFASQGLQSLHGVDNRLELVAENRGFTIRDAYNSNPLGFASALNVMRSLPGKRRILVTPGMIELGAQQAEENRRIAELAANACDLVVQVGHTNRASLVEGFRKGGMRDDQIILTDTRDEALAKLVAMRMPEDVVLIENDLTDLHEGSVRL